MSDCKNCPGCKGEKEKNSRWREDFPVQWEKDHYITRREMAKYLSLGSLLLAGANGLVAALPHVFDSHPYPEVKINGASQLPVKSALLFHYPTEDDPCILIRRETGELVAYSQVCTHLSCAVIYEAQENTLFCPCHHGYFTVAEGRPSGGPPTRPLPRIKLEQQGNEIFAVGVEI